MTLFHKVWYYDPDLKYDGMDITDGASAMIQWAQMVYGGVVRSVAEDMSVSCCLRLFNIELRMESLIGRFHEPSDFH